MKKEDRIRMLLHPEKYTDEQLDRMLNETSIPMPDANKEWAIFKKEKKEVVKNGNYFNSIKKIAAMLVGVLMLSGIAYATISHFIETDEKPKTAITERKLDDEKVKKTAGIEMAPTENTPVVFNNVELQQIMQYIANGYDVKVEFKNETAGTLRFYLQWEADDTLQEIIDKINHFEKVHLTLHEETIIIE